MPFSEQELQLLENLMAKPKARATIHSAIKENFPEFPLPEYDAKKEVEDKFMEQFKKQQEELEKLRNEVSSSKVDREWEKQAAKIKKELNWDDAKLSEFQKAFAEEFNGKTTMDMLDMAEYYELKNRPLTPSHNPSRVGPFGIRNDQSDTAQWRKDKDDPKSPMFSKNKKEKKAYFRKQWAEARQEMLERGIK